MKNVSILLHVRASIDLNKEELMMQMDYTYSLKRIAEALERIAEALEEQNDKSGLLGEKETRTTTAG